MLTSGTNAFQGREACEQDSTGKAMVAATTTNWTNRYIGPEWGGPECRPQECGWNCPGHTPESPAGPVQTDHQFRSHSSDSVGLGWDQRPRLSSKFPSAAAAAAGGSWETL